jgi:putative hydrolase of the HAD superfamily
MPLIRAVLFDYGLVLSAPPDPHAWCRMHAILNAQDPSFHDAYWHHRHNYDLGVLSGDRYWRTVGNDLHRDPSTDDLTALLDADVDLWTQPNQPMIAWAGLLQRSNIATGILSNIGDAMEDGIGRRCPWLAQFQHLTFSHRLRIAKPDERIYHHAVAGLGVAPAETLFLDDRLENVEAARAVGLNAIQYATHEDFLRDFTAGQFTGLPLPGKTVPSRSS